MNLVTDYINELGGYEVAKKKNTSWLLNHGENWRNVKDATLLEYRRQHNIFEVGDKVVVKDHPFWPEDYVILTVEQEHIGKWYMSAWRHATDAEIKAGKRFEVKSEN